jgi:DNA-binding response OmpR family regulator
MPASRAPVAVGTETIVVAEDEPLVRAMTKRTLERAGYHVFDAPNGAEALHLMRTLDAPPDLLITDIVMPVMGGRELASAIEREFPHVRILFMSGYTHERVAHLGDQSGVSRFLHKPFTLDELRTRVRMLLDQATSAA